MIRCGGTLAAIVTLVSTASVGASAKDEGALRPMLVEIFAEWCGTCAKLKPTFEKLEQEVGVEALIVILDVTDRPALEKSSKRADRLRIREFFDANRSMTGTVGVFDAQGRIVEVIRGEHDPARYIEALRKAGAQGARTTP